MCLSFALKKFFTFQSPTCVRRFVVRLSAIELGTSSRLWSPAIIKPLAWSASLLPGKVNPFAVISTLGRSLWGGVLAPRPTLLLSHPGLGPAMAEFPFHTDYLNSTFQPSPRSAHQAFHHTATLRATGCGLHFPFYGWQVLAIWRLQ